MITIEPLEFKMKTVYCRRNGAGLKIEILLGVDAKDLSKIEPKFNTRKRLVVIVFWDKKVETPFPAPPTTPPPIPPRVIFNNLNNNNNKEINNKKIYHGGGGSVRGEGGGKDLQSWAIAIVRTEHFPRTKLLAQRKITNFRVTHQQLAKKLADIIHKEYNVKSRAQQLVKWGKIIEKMERIDDISLKRIKAVLDWYSAHIGDEFVPVVQSGSSLRSKFIKLEAAIQREGKGRTRRGQSNKDSTPYASTNPLTDYITDQEPDLRPHQKELDRNLEDLCQWWSRLELSMRKRSKTKFMTMPDFDEFLEGYFHWLVDNTNIGLYPGMLSTQSKSLRGYMRRLRKYYGFDLETGEEVS